MDLALIQKGASSYMKRAFLFFGLCFVSIHSLASSKQMTSHSIVITRPVLDAAHISWQHNNHSQPWAEPTIELGGAMNLPMKNFPPNLRRFGPNSSHSFSTTLHALHMPLLAQHPLDKRWIPMLAERWWFDYANNRIFLEIHPKAQWSDNTPVTTQDIRFSIDFLLNPSKQAHWQRTQLKSLLHSVEIFDDKRFAFHLNNSLTPYSMQTLAAFKPLAAHFYDDLEWPQEANWSPEPVTGPYSIQQIHHNESLVLRTENNWWARDLRFFVGRFNVTRFTFHVSDADNDAIQQLTRAEFDVLPLNENDQNHALIQSIWQKNNLNLYQRRTQTANELLLLNTHHSALDTRAKRLQVIKLIHQKVFVSLPIIYNDSAVLSNIEKPYHSETTALSKAELLTRLQNNNYALAWITFDNPLTIDSVDFWLRQQNLPHQDDSIRHLLPLSNNHYTLAWPWVQLPHNLQQWQQDPFEPFDSVHGGLFWIDKRIRGETIGHPARINKNTAQIITIGAAH